MIGGIIWVAASMFVVHCVGDLVADSNRYQRAFVDYFEDELVRFSYEWKKVVNEYLFSGPEPMFNSVIADCKFIHTYGQTTERTAKC